MKKREKVEELEKYFNGFKGKIFIFQKMFVYTFNENIFQDIVWENTEERHLKKYMNRLLTLSSKFQ